MKLIVMALLLLTANLMYAEDSASPNISEDILKDPLIKEKYEKCKSEIEENSKDSNAYKITNDLLKDCADKAYGELTDDQKDTLVKKYTMGKKSGQQLSEKSDNNYTYTPLTTSSKLQTDPAYLKLQEYLSDKLWKAIYGEGANEFKTKDGKIKMTNHAVFYDLYKSRISKGITETFSWYCMDANLESDFKIPEKELNGKKIENTEKVEENRKTNISLLQKMNVIDGKKINVAYQKWMNCVGQISVFCYGLQEVKDKTGATIQSPESPAEGPTKERACIVMDQIKKLRASLLATEDIQKKWDRHDKTNTGYLNLGMAEIYQGKDTNENKHNSIDDLSSLTSGDFVKASEFKKGEGKSQEELVKELQECQKKPPEELTKTCKDLIAYYGDEKNLQNIVTEYDAKAKLLDSKLDKLSTDPLKNKEEILNYLKAEGFEESDLKDLSDDEIAAISTEIKERFESEKDALQEKIKGQLKKIAQNKDTNSKQQNINKLKTIEEQIKKKIDRDKQLIHFNNIVSGYLQVKDQNGKEVGKNTASIQRELDNSAYSKENIEKLKQNRGPSDTSSEENFKPWTPEDENHLSKVEEGFKEDSGKDANKNSKGDSTLYDIKAINDRLKYDALTKEKKAETTP